MITPAESDFPATFSALRKILAGSAKSLNVSADTAFKYYLETKSPSYKGKPMSFAAVVLGKAYVSFHFLPLYWNPGLGKSISPELKKRRQGKACFNFKAPDQALFAELQLLTERGLSEYRDAKLL